MALGLASQSRIVIACLVLRVLVVSCLPTLAHAQGVVERPGDKRPALPTFPDASQRQRILPPVEPLPPEASGLGGDGLRIPVREFRIEGSTVFDEGTLSNLLRPYTGRALSSSDLRRARDAITRHYVAAGYLSSGAVLPDQPVRDGVVVLRVVEGRLSDVRISGHRHYRLGYLRARLERDVGHPLRLSRVENAIRRLQNETGIERVDAALRPGLNPGETVLEIDLQETNALSARVQTDNHRPPSVGEIGGRVSVRHENLMGRDDHVLLSVSGSEGLIDVGGRYDAPLGGSRWRLGGHVSWTDGRVVESEFDSLDIEVESLTLGLSLDRTLIDQGPHRLSGQLMADLRHSRTRLLGLRQDFPSSGTERGDANATVLRGALDWTYRERDQVIAARSTLSWGIDVLDASDASAADRGTSRGELPNGRFLSWLGQAQWARRLAITPTFRPVARLRLDTQLSSDPLLPFERFSVGGHSSIRGFRENQLVTDQGLIGSAELRVPLPAGSASRPWIFVTPFYDVGYAWNRDRPTPGRTTLQSVGFSIDAAPLDWLRGELTLGWPVDGGPDGDTLQEEGVSFRVEMRF